MLKNSQRKFFKHAFSKPVAHLFFLASISVSAETPSINNQQSSKTEYLKIYITKDSEQAEIKEIDVFYMAYKDNPREICEGGRKYTISILDQNNKALNEFNCGFYEHVAQVFYSSSEAAEAHKNDPKVSYFSISLSVKYKPNMKKVRIFDGPKLLAESNVQSHDEWYEIYKQKEQALISQQKRDYQNKSWIEKMKFKLFSFWYYVKRKIL